MKPLNERLGIGTRKGKEEEGDQGIRGEDLSIVKH
jgi:hypothetical protein